MNGWIILDKPLGLSSAQGVAAIKRLLRTAGLPVPKIGHGGTIDPRTAGMLLVAALMLGSCSNVCTNTVIADIGAPGGRRHVTLFQRDCGATTDFSTQISILGLGTIGSDGGNTFIADRGVDAEAGPWGGPWADVRWLSPDQLLVQYAPSSRVFSRKTDIDGVAISYRQIPPVLALSSSR